MDSHLRSAPMLRTLGTDAMMGRIASRLFDIKRAPVRVGKFEILETIGSGGMGVVYRARDSELNREAALKLLHPRISAGPRARARLMREAQALAKLSHPNVVQLFDVGRHEGQIFLAMECVGGCNLREWRASSDAGWRTILGHYLQAGAGLDAAHGAGLVHRDFKPDNCIVDPDGRVRVLDFGLVSAGPEDFPTTESKIAADDEASSSLNSATPLTSQSTLLGTVPYMAPEQLRGDEVDAKADQFSFCASVFEALFGMSPYLGNTAEQRLHAFSSSGPARIPPGHRVPISVVRALRRGLSIDPGERWPSMHPLLDRLERASRPRWTRWTASIALSASLGALAWGVWYPSSQRCQGATQQLDGIWDKNRSAAVASAFTASGASLAPTTWHRIEAGLDRYRDEWLAKHTGICEATTIRGEQSPEAMDLQMRCLHDHRRRLSATVDILERAAPDVVLKAPELVVGLPGVDLCDDRDRLAAGLQPPQAPGVAAQAEAIRDTIARIDVSLGIESIEGSDLDKVVRDAESLEYPPLLAEALLMRGLGREFFGRYSEAEDDLWKARLIALEHGHATVQLTSAERLASVVGVHLARHEEGVRLAESTIALARHQNNRRQEAKAYNTLGLINGALGDLDRALEMNERAHSIFKEILAPTHPIIGASFNNLGLVLNKQGQFSEAEKMFRHALEIRRTTFGDDHPDYAQSLGNLALSFKVQGRYKESEAMRREVLAIMRRAFGNEHPKVARNLNNLGGVLQAQGRYDEAEQAHWQALEIQKEVFPPGHTDIAYTLNNLGASCGHQGRLSEAADFHRKALKIRVARFGMEHPHVAHSLTNLGRILTKQGRWSEAEDHLLNGLAIRERTLGPDHIRVAKSLVALAHNARRNEQFGKARAWAARAVEIHKMVEVSAEDRADAQFLLARVLEPGRIVEARALAKEAQSTYLGLGTQAATTAASEIDRWFSGE